MPRWHLEQASKRNPQNSAEMSVPQQEAPGSVTPITVWGLQPHLCHTSPALSPHVWWACAQTTFLPGDAACNHRTVFSSTTAANSVKAALGDEPTQGRMCRRLQRAAGCWETVWARVGPGRSLPRDQRQAPRRRCPAPRRLTPRRSGGGFCGRRINNCADRDALPWFLRATLTIPGRSQRICKQTDHAPSTNRSCSQRN